MAKVLMKDIAQKANVSLATVSYILNNVESQSISNETREKVLRIACEMNYVPNLNARSLASKRSGLIGILINKENDLIERPWKDLLYSSFINKMEHLLKSKGYHILLSSIDVSSTELNIIQQRELDGALLLDVNNEKFHTISSYFNTPIILIDSYVDDNLFTKIVLDYSAAIKKALTLVESPAFLVADKVNSDYVREQIIKASGLSRENIIFIDSKDEMNSFLNNYKNKNGIIINEYLGLIAANSMPASKLAVICSCGCSELLPMGTKRVVFENNKAELAAELILSYIGKTYNEKKNLYIVNAI
jgi:hypothetical protein